MDRFAEQLSPQQIEQAAEHTDQAAQLAKPAADPELERIKLANLERAFADRRRLLADAITVSQAAQLLGVGRQAPHDRVRSESLLAVRDNGRLKLPRWQFDADGPDAGSPHPSRCSRAARLSRRCATAT